MAFHKAKKEAVYLKLAVTGPSGSGKTTGALLMARGLVGPTGTIAVLDTENRSASLYSDLTDFVVEDVAIPAEAKTFLAAIDEAEREHVDALVIDSFSHVWEMVLDYKDRLDCRGGNSYTNWKEANKQWNPILSRILQAQMHVICCLRAKTDYVIETNDKGKQAPRKVGLAPITRDGTEFEFTTVFDLDMKHQATASKDRTRLFADRFVELNEVTGQQFAGWLTGPDPERVTLSNALLDITPNPEKTRGWLAKNPPIAEIENAITKAKEAQ